MPKPIIRIHNTETNEVIDREMTDSEFKAYEDEKARIAQDVAELAAKETEKNALLAKLGITADEAKLLLG
jgi:hypothetical protein